MSLFAGPQLSPIVRFSDIDPARIALVVGRHEIDFGRFASDVAEMASWLAGQGLSVGQTLGILVNHPYWAWVANLAAMRLGLTSATLTSNFRQEIAAFGELDAIVGHVPSTATAKMANRVIPFSVQSLTPLAEQLELTRTSPDRMEPQAESHAQRLLFTSGTTGKPKAVVWDFEMLHTRVSLVQRSQKVSSETRLIALLGMDTTGGFRYPLATWQAGGCVLFGEPDPESRETRYARTLFEHSNLLLSSPQRLETTLSTLHGTWKGKEARTIIVLVGRLPRVLREQAHQIAGCEVSIAYGATETGSIAAGDASLLDRHSGAVGFAVEGANVQIVDGNDSPKPRGESGIIRTRTSYMVHKYEGVEQNDQYGAFRHGWFYPGDHGVIFEDGLLAIEGRGSEIVNISGRKFSLTELETALTKLPEVQDIGAAMLKTDAGDQLNLAVVCSASTDLNKLSQQIALRLPVITKFRLVRIKTIPRNAMGKIVRNSLTEQLLRLLQG